MDQILEAFKYKNFYFRQWFRAHKECIIYLIELVN
jgi:hypothetical protein